MDRNDRGAPISGLPLPAFQIAVGLGDPDRERALLSVLWPGEELVVVARALSADELLASVQTHAVDAVVVADDLHRLNREILAALARRPRALLLLAARPDDACWKDLPATILPIEAHPLEVRSALLTALRHARLHRTIARDAATVVEELPAAPDEPSLSTTIAVASGYGSPGRTCVALNLAVALGAVAPVILVDADVQGPSIAASLDLDPTRNLFMLAHADPQTPRDWERALAQELQPLGARSPHGVALCGIPKPEMRAGISADFIARLFHQLRARARFVILDVGAELLGSEMILHRRALGACDQVLFIAAADLVGLWHARVGLGVLARSLGIGSERVALVINRHDPRYHHPPREIAWALGQPLAALIPNDSAAAQTALLRQQPLVYDRRGRASRSLLDLARRVHGGTIVLPPEPAPAPRVGLLRRIASTRFRRPFGRTASPSGTGGWDEPDLARTL